MKARTPTSVSDRKLSMPVQNLVRKARHGTEQKFGGGSDSSQAKHDYYNDEPKHDHYRDSPSQE